MKTIPKPKTIYLKDYQAPNFKVETVNLQFDLYDEHVFVFANLQIKRLTAGNLTLYGDELELISIELNDLSLKNTDYNLDANKLILKHCPDLFQLKITTRIFPQNNTALSGLYRSKNLFATQCEAEGFRRITFFPDRPDVLAVYTTKITADQSKYPVLLSNGNLIAKGDLPDLRHWVEWHDPFPKPSYLFALVAGKLSCVQDSFITSSGKIIDLKIFVEPNNINKCEHALLSLKKAMRWDEERFGREYDLNTYMIVAVDDFNMGAMENKGLNIFNSQCILASPTTTTDNDFIYIEGVIAHEYFHNWTGNRITCRDWFQLSLKEGLTIFRDQEFTRDMNSRDLNRILDVKVLRNSQFPEDSSAMAHPVRPESYQEINNFYTTTVYNKGAEVIRMQQTLLGKDGFRKGMDLYFKRHDGCAVTIEDFVKAMEDANNVDFKQFRLWYSQAGTPEVEVFKEYDAQNKTLIITMTQTCPPTPECKNKLPFHIPIKIAFWGSNGNQIVIDKKILELREQKQSFIFSNLNEKPYVSLLLDFSAPIKLKQELSQEELIALMRFETNGPAKWEAARLLALACFAKFFSSSQENFEIPAEQIEAYRAIILDEKLDPALRAELLTPPSFEDVASTLSSIDVIQVERARDFFRVSLGKNLFNEANILYQKLCLQEEHAIEAMAFSKRKLRNLCLWLMMHADESKTLNLCQQQLKNARTMTDQLASLSLLNNCPIKAVRDEAINYFYEKWSKDELVLNKWFAIVASSELPDLLPKVKKLLTHPDFTLNNPNKVRSLIGTFCHTNYRNFHAADGSGYKFLTKILIECDKINPQMTAKLATPFTRWRRYIPKLQTLIKKELHTLAALDLSPDLRELVDKSLA